MTQTISASLLGRIPTIILLATTMVVNTLRPRQNGRNFANDIFKCILLNENTSISINISLKFVPGGRINNIPAFVQIMAWRRLGGKPLSEPMMIILLTHICVTRPQWVKILISWEGFLWKKFYLRWLKQLCHFWADSNFLVIASVIESFLFYQTLFHYINMHFSSMHFLAVF